MRLIRRKLGLLLGAPLLLWSCERHPLEQQPLSPPDDGMSVGMTPRGPQAGPMSAQAPTVLSVDGAAPTILSAAGAAPTPLADDARAQVRVAPPLAPESFSANPGILWQNRTTGERSIWRMNGANFEGSFILLPTVDPGWEIAGSADFNGNHSPDILWQHLGTGQRSIWFTDEGVFEGQYAILPTVHPQWEIVGAADFNRNGHSDILWQHRITGQRSIWFMNGPVFEGDFAILPTVDPDWEMVAAADFNRDGNADILWQHRPTGFRSIWFMNGPVWEGHFALLPQVDPSWEMAGAADYSGDGNADILWQQPTSGFRSIWLMNGPVWEGNFALLPIVPAEWDIAGAFDPRRPATLGPWTQVSTGQNHTCALNAAGQAYCWGLNEFGQLGDETTTRRNRPVPVAGGHTWTSIAAGYHHTCGINTAGDAYCWGRGGNGQLGIGTTVNLSSPTTRVAVTGGDTWASVTPGEFHTCGTTPDGRAFCWGLGQYGRLGHGSTSSQSTRALVSGEHTWRSVSAGQDHTCGVTTENDAYCWGFRGSGQRGDGGGVQNQTVPRLVVGGHHWLRLTAGHQLSCGITTAADAYCWGAGGNGQRGDGTTESTRNTPALVLNDHKWASLHAGRANTCGITPAGEGYCWGWNAHGQIGNGTQAAAQTVPALVSGGFAWATLSTGNEHTCGSTTNRGAYCWGRGVDGALGNGAFGTAVFTTPNPVLDP